MATGVRAVDGSEVAVRLGRREQAAGAAIPALGRKRTEEGAGGGGGDGVDEEGAVLAGGPGALGACVEAVALDLIFITCNTDAVCDSEGTFRAVPKQGEPKYHCSN